MRRKAVTSIRGQSRVAKAWKRGSREECWRRGNEPIMKGDGWAGEEDDVTQQVTLPVCYRPFPVQSHVADLITPF